MGGSGVAWVSATTALAFGVMLVGCGSSKSSDSDHSGASGTGGQALGGTSGQGDSGRPSGGAGIGGRAGSATGSGGEGGSAGLSTPSGGAGGTAALAGTSGSAGVSGNATGGALGDSGAAGEGGGGASGGSAGSGAGSPSIDCSGTFGEPRMVLYNPGGRLFSPTLTADEKEMLYASDAAGDYLRYFRSTRASKADMFDSAESVPELDAACTPTDDRTIDLTGDGLRAYLVCYGPDNPESNVLRIAERPTLDAPFVLDEKRYGEAGPSAAVAPGELALYSSGVSAASDPALFFERTATSEPFGAGTTIPGLEGTPFITPDPSADGLLLFGAVSLPAGTMNGIVLATRATVRDPFSAPEPIVTSESSGEWLSPTISEDCRSLYVVHLPSSAPRGVEVFER